jgi:hypothetical protein
MSSLVGSGKKSTNKACWRASSEHRATPRASLPNGESCFQCRAEGRATKTAKKEGEEWTTTMEPFSIAAVAEPLSPLSLSPAKTRYEVNHHQSMTVNPNPPIVTASRPTKPKPEERMYLPAVYRYSCQGAFAASSLEVGSPGNCRGFRSRMEHLVDMNPSTRAEALTNFTGDAVSVGDEVSLIEDGRPNPALLYPAARAPSEDPAGVAWTSGSGSKANNNNVLQESWSAFGSTEVECLQLTDLKSGQTSIVAVSPYNSAIVSSRKIQFPERTVSSTELGIGPYKMQFLIESGVTRGESRSHEEHDHAEDLSRTAAAQDLAAPAPAQVTSTTETAQQLYQSSGVFLGKMHVFSGKIIGKMQANGEWLYGNLKDDFPARTVASGRRIVDQMPKTAAIFSKVVKQIFGYDDDER